MSDAIDRRVGLPDTALDDRQAIVGISGSGKTFTAKGMVERLLGIGARVCIVDPLGVWWGLRAGADGGPGFPVVVFGGEHADVPITEAMGATLASAIATNSLACVVDVSALGSGAARRRFMTAFAETLYEKNREPLHLVLDEADLWCPQRPLPEAQTLLGRMDEIVRRGRVRGFIPWLITQRPAVLHKDVLSQVDILIAMKLTSSQDRDAIGGWIEGQADRADGKRILADLPRLARGEGYVWAPAHGVLERVTFPLIHSFDSSRTPKRGEKLRAPLALAPVDLSAIKSALEAVQEQPAGQPADGKALATAQQKLRAAEAEAMALRGEVEALRGEVEALRGEVEALRDRLRQIGALACQPAVVKEVPTALPPPAPPAPPKPAQIMRDPMQKPAAKGGGAELRILGVLAARHPAAMTMAQWATLAGMSRKGGTWTTYVSRLRTRGLIEQSGNLFRAAEPATDAPPPAAPKELRQIWGRALGSGPARIMAELNIFPRGLSRDEIARRVGMEPKGGTFGTYLSRLRSNDLIAQSGGMIALVGELLDH